MAAPSEMMDFDEMEAGEEVLRVPLDCVCITSPCPCDFHSSRWPFMWETAEMVDLEEGLGSSAGGILASLLSSFIWNQESAGEERAEIAKELAEIAKEMAESADEDMDESFWPSFFQGMVTDSLSSAFVNMFKESAGEERAEIAKEMAEIAKEMAESADEGFG